MAAELLQGVSVSGTGTARPLRSKAGKRLGSVFGAETVTELLYCVLAHPSKGLVDASNAPPLTAKFGRKPYTRSYCMPPAATGPFVSKKKNHTTCEVFRQESTT